MKKIFLFFSLLLFFFLIPAIAQNTLQYSHDAAGVLGGIINNGLDGVSNSLKLIIGLFYLDENASFSESIIQGVSRHTWESLQTGFGYDYTQFRNAFGSSIDRVDYFGGVTFATNEYSSRGDQGITIGNYSNIDIVGRIDKNNFEDYITNNPLYMHEYGHTIDSRKKGPLFFIVTAPKSLLSALRDHINGTNDHRKKSYEKRANWFASNYFFKYYSVDWTKYLKLYPY